jgi:hypothetical protein
MLAQVKGLQLAASQLHAVDARLLTGAHTWQDGKMSMESE